MSDTTEKTGDDMIDPVTGEIIDQRELVQQLLEQAEMAEWSSRPLDPLYPVIFVDAIVVKVRDGSPCQARGAPSPQRRVLRRHRRHGERENATSLASGPATGAKAARFWLQEFTEPKNRDVEDVFIAVCYADIGIASATGSRACRRPSTTTWEHTVVQQSIVHLIRNSSATRADSTATRSSRSTPATAE